MGEWKTTTIGEIAEVYDGPHATPPKTQSGPWFLSISSLDNGRLNLAESAHISEADFERWTRRVTPREGDVLFSYETRLGEAALMPAGLRACLGRRMGLLRPKPDRVDSRFLLYAYLGPEFQEVIRQRAVHGATVDRIPLTELPNWPISIPSLREQRAIAAVLGALDDKIAASEWIAQTALELGTAIYAHRASTAPTWRSVSLADAAQWYSGGTPRTTEPAYWNGHIPWISAISLKSPWIDDSPRKLTSLGAANGTRLVPPGAIIFVVRGSSLKEEFRIGIAQCEVAFGQDCKALVAADGIDHDLLFHAIRHHTADILELVDETSIDAGRLATDLIEKLLVRVPDTPSDATVDALKSLNQSAAAKQRESRTLAELRDTLLPKLMSGELR